MRQARPTWDLERALRRAVLRERLLAVVGGVAIAAGTFIFLTLLFTS